VAAGCVQSASEHACGRGIATLYSVGGKHYLVHQRVAWGQVTESGCPQVFLHAVVITGRQCGSGQQQAAVDGGQMAGQFGGGAQIAQ